jgi:hypothetical protein
MWWRRAPPANRISDEVRLNTLRRGRASEGPLSCLGLGLLRRDAHDPVPSYYLNLQGGMHNTYVDKYHSRK